MTAKMFPGAYPQSRILSRIHELFSTARSFHSTSDALNESVNKVLTELESKTKTGARRYPIRLASYARACRDVMHAHYWHSEMEFCYRDDSGKIYSTWRDSTHASMEELYALELTSTQWDAMDRANVWKGTSKPFTEWSKYK